MKKGFFALILLLAGMMFPRWVLAVSVEARVDRTSISRHESVVLTVKITGDDGAVDVSAIEDFKVISSGSSSSVSIVNGAMTRESSNNYLLTPVKTGSLMIPELSVEVDGEVHKTQPISVQVSETPPRSGKTEDIFMETSISSEHPYAGQAVTYTVKIYHVLRMANANLQPPEFSGFEAKKMENDRTYSSLSGSRQYNVIELNYVLTPLKTGEFVIEPPMLNCDVIQRGSGRGRGSIFDDPFFGSGRLEPRTVTGDSISVLVRPLPSYQGEVPFSGLVGILALDAATDSAEARVGDSITLSVTLSGSGNLPDAPDPDIKVSEAFKVYKDKSEEQIQFDEKGYSGKKNFRTALVPVKAGEFVLPPIKIAYFDLNTEAYRILETRPLALKIMPSAEKEGMSPDLPEEEKRLPAFEKKAVEIIGRDILPLKEDPDALWVQEPLSLYGFIFYLLVPAACFGAARVYRKLGTKPLDDRALMAKRAALALKTAGKPGIEEESFLGSLYAALVSAVFSRTGVRGESLTGVEMRKMLESAGHAKQVGDTAAELLNRIEEARFGGMKLDEAAKKQLFLDVKAMVERLV
jgi:hypothetical protein